MCGAADEIGVLASSLNHMRGSIADREKRILKLAYEDPLTDLANRSRFSNELERAITQAAQGKLKLTILMMDLDRFKYVNDTLGHGVGDHVLREVSARLQRTVTSAECIARLGGDEFAILRAARRRHRLRRDGARRSSPRSKRRSSSRASRSTSAPASASRTTPSTGSDAQTLVRNADIAMYAAKRNKTGFATYDQHYDTSQQEHLSLLGELRRAVERNELRLYYQPKVSLHSSQRERGRSADPLGASGARPGAAGAVHPVRRAHRLHQATDALGAARSGAPVRRMAARGPALQVSVNISARDLMNRELPEHVAALLAEHDVTPGLLCLEITESGFMEDPAHAQKVLDRLAELGVKLSIDDYGTGYSSLSYIMRLPVQELKIDQSFISRMATDAEISTIVRSTIDLGHNLGLQVVAEGVEDLVGVEHVARARLRRRAGLLHEQAARRRARSRTGSAPTTALSGRPRRTPPTRRRPKCESA